MKQTEMEIVKSASADLGGGLVAVFAYQYHTEPDPGDPEGRRVLKSKSRYRVLATTMPREDWEKRIADLKKRAEVSLDPWKWPDDPTWDGNILYSLGCTVKNEAKWLSDRLRKALPWETAKLVLRGYKKNLDAPRRSKEYGRYTVLNEGAAWPTENALAKDGERGSLLDPEFLKRHSGETVSLEIQPKRARAGAEA